jgi:Mg2+-importing ATPase
MEDALKDLSCSENGLSGAEAGTRLKQYGPNTFKARSRSSSFILFLLQFKSPLTLLLIAAALLSMGFGRFYGCHYHTDHYPGEQSSWFLAGKRCR